MLKKKENHLILIDGYAILFRAFYAIPGLKNENGLAIGAIHGVIKVLMQILRNHSNSHIVVALDGAEGLLREKMYPEYKQNRPDAPSDLVRQFVIFEEMMKSAGLPYCRVNGYEADDIIATFAKIGRSNNQNVTVVSGDKDLMQLIADGVEYFYISSQKKDYVDESYVIEKFGVMPNMICDYLALVGDKVDNIPGITSIGPKTASELINEYGSVENIYSNISKIKNEKTREKLAKGMRNAILSKQLVMLQNNIDCLPAMEDLFFEGIKMESFMQFLKKYGLKSIIKSMESEVVKKKENLLKVEKKDKDKNVENGRDVQNSFDF